MTRKSAKPLLGFAAYLEHLRQTEPDPRSRGNKFERLARDFLEHDPLMRRQFSEVMLWSEWQSRHSDKRTGEMFEADTGIDLVAKHVTGDGYTAIQCKCYGPDSKISLQDIATFITAVDPKSDADFKDLLLVYTGRGLTDDADKRAKNRSVKTINELRLERTPLLWHPNGQLATDVEQTLRKPNKHQTEAIRHCLQGLENYDRGQLIMACGTGKTYTGLQIAEQFAGKRGRVLVAVPSIALVNQTMREYATHATMSHRYAAVCSDTSIGKGVYSEGDVENLEIPPTTKPQLLAKFLAEDCPDDLTVVFATYHSLPTVSKALIKSATVFDLIIADEAHRTTGIERLEALGSESKWIANAFQIIHDDTQIPSNKRLYMTATPKVYAANSYDAAKIDAPQAYSMDDESVYGPKFHTLDFRTAVDAELLCDYKVIVLGVPEAFVRENDLAEDTDSPLDLSDRSRVMGLFSALCEPNDPTKPDALLKRGITYFSSRIRSKAFTRLWDSNFADPEKSSSEAVQQLGRGRSFTVSHIDGKMRANTRQERLHNLTKGGETQDQRDNPLHSHTLSNVHVLTEGVDVPALDWLAFMDPKGSYIQIVQAVGRVMRKPQGNTKDTGYIIIPVAVPDGQNVAELLRKNVNFKTVWRVLNALRSHDAQLDADINACDLNKSLPAQLEVRPAFQSLGAHSDRAESTIDGQLAFTLLGGGNGIDIPLELLTARIAEQCGDAPYWVHWVRDIAGIFDEIKAIYQDAITKDPSGALEQAFERTGKALGNTIGPQMGEARVLDIVAQHTLVRRIFDAIFPDQDFLTSNPVAKAMERLTKQLSGKGLDAELGKLERVYRFVEQRAQAINTTAGRQELLKKVYEGFIRQVFAKEAEAMGVVYTPIAIIDFMVRSVNDLLHKHFDEQLTDENVHVLDPFTGTGAFLVRMLELEMINEGDLVRKYKKELHANEIMLLPYYIALLNITNAFRATCERQGVQLNEIQVPATFPGLAYTDTFKATKRGVAKNGNQFDFGENWEENAKNVKNQRQLPIKVILGNPPWRAGQTVANDDNRNLAYPHLDDRIKKTYAAKSTSGSKRWLYDQYKRAMRWASDRIEKRGIVAYVTNESWYTKATDDGVRASLEEEFDDIYIVHLGGSLRSGQGEGDNVFGVTVGITILILVRTGEERQLEHKARVRRLELNKPMSATQKLDALTAAGSIVHTALKKVSNVDNYDWYVQADETFSELIPLGTRATKAGTAEEAFVRTYSHGFLTGDDAHAINFSRERCTQNMSVLISAYNDAVTEIVTSGSSNARVEEAMKKRSDQVSWTRELSKKARAGKRLNYDPGKVCECMIAPFTSAYVYFDAEFMKTPSLMPTLFPTGGQENHAILLTDVGSPEFAVTATAKVPELHTTGQTKAIPEGRPPPPPNI